MAAGATQTSVEVDPGASVDDVVALLVQRGNEGLRDHLLAPGGTPHATLLVAVDGAQVRDTARPLPAGAREIALVSPMAGG